MFQMHFSKLIFPALALAGAVLSIPAVLPGQTGTVTVTPTVRGPKTMPEKACTIVIDKYGDVWCGGHKIG